MRIAKVVAAILAVLALAALAVWWVIRPDAVTVSGRRVEVQVRGEGTPTVVFESGFESSRLLWWLAQHRVSALTRTVTYARAGMGSSDPSPDPRTAEQIAVELHQLLQTLHLPPPYILVGHSAGALYVRVFAHRYPAQIAGLVLVDPATADDYDRMRLQTPAEWSNATAQLHSLGERSGLLGQWLALPATLEQARSAWPLPAVPTVILTSTAPTGNWPLATAADLVAFTAAQARLAARIPGARRIDVPGTNHLSILGASAVSDQILLMLQTLRHPATGTRAD